MLNFFSFDTINLNKQESNKTKKKGIINEEIGLVFKEVLECAGVYKCTDEGRAAFQKFIDAVNL